MKSPILSYTGSKWTIAPWIHARLPEAPVFVDVFGGGGSIILRGERRQAEVYNDIDGELVNLFRVVRDRPDELARACALTFHSRAEYLAAYDSDAECGDVERARRALVRFRVCIGPTGGKKKPGFNREIRNGKARVFWPKMEEMVRAVSERFQGVIIEQLEAPKILKLYDRPETLFYLDPPYLPETWSTGVYTGELTRKAHVELLEQINGLSAQVAISGYPSDLYDEALSGWHRYEKKTHARCVSKGSLPRTEVLWVKPGPFSERHPTEVPSTPAEGGLQKKTPT